MPSPTEILSPNYKVFFKDILAKSLNLQQNCFMWVCRKGPRWEESKDFRIKKDKRVGVGRGAFVHLFSVLSELLSTDEKMEGSLETSK